MKKILSVFCTHEDGVTHTTDKFRFALNFTGYEYVRNSETGLYEYNTDGSIKTKNKTFLTYGSPDWYILGVDDSEWRPSGDGTYYGIPTNLYIANAADREKLEKGLCRRSNDDSSHQTACSLR